LSNVDARKLVDLEACELPIQQVWAIFLSNISRHTT